MKILTFFIVTAILSGPVPEVRSNAERISKCASIELNGSIEKVFPLFGPVLEKEWADGWNAEIIYSASGIVEEHMIFRTKAHHGPEDDLGNQLNRASLEKMFAHDLQDWEEALNYYITNGKILKQ